MIAHAAAQDSWPVMFGFAGLPSLPRILAEAKSYAERFQYSKIEQLSVEAAGAVLILPAAEEDAAWDGDAVDVVVEASGRYPYFLQQFGQDTWGAATGPQITRVDAEIGVARGTAQLDNGFFRARWDRATPGEQLYMRAMAPDGDEGSASGEVAARLKKNITSLGPTRANLISKGLVYAPEHGVIAFTVPGMAAFIDRQLTE